MKQEDVRLTIAEADPDDLRAARPAMLAGQAVLPSARRRLWGTEWRLCILSGLSDTYPRIVMSTFWSGNCERPGPKRAPCSITRLVVVPELDPQDELGRLLTSPRLHRDATTSGMCHPRSTLAGARAGAA